MFVDIHLVLPEAQSWWYHGGACNMRYLCFLACDLVTFNRVNLRFSGVLHKEFPELRTASDPGLKPSPGLGSNQDPGSTLSLSLGPDLSRGPSPSLYPGSCLGPSTGPDAGPGSTDLTSSKILQIVRFCIIKIAVVKDINDISDTVTMVAMWGGATGTGHRSSMFTSPICCTIP